MRTETVYESGRVEWRVVGHSDDDGTITASGVREYGPLDLDAVEAARLGSGWTLAAPGRHAVRATPTARHVILKSGYCVARRIGYALSVYPNARPRKVAFYRDFPPVYL